MSTLLHLTESMIRLHSSGNSFQRGQEYVEQDMVDALVQRGDILQATVEGSSYEPYTVTIELSDDGVAGAVCTCPYDQGGWCKHIVATLLSAAHAPEEIEQRPSLRDLLTGIDRDGLMALLLKLVERNPHLADVLENGAVLLQRASILSATSTPSIALVVKPTTVNAAAIARQVQAIHQGRGGSLFALLEQVNALLTTGSGREALAFLEALTEANVAGENFEMWEGRYDIEDEPNYFLTQLGSTWAEALLTVDLTAQERQAWASKLENWLLEPADYGYDEIFDGAIAAARQGWDDPALRRVLQGDSTEPISSAVEVDEWRFRTNDLTQIRLAILERQGRDEEYLRLAAAEGRVAAYATMLVTLKRLQEAASYGLANLTTTEDALPLAQALWAGGAAEDARDIAAYGLTLQGRKETLAIWLRDIAILVGDTQQALFAAVEVFKEHPGLSIYHQVRELDEEGWSARRETLLEHLRKPAWIMFAEGPVDIFLHEGLIDDAIAFVQRNHSHREVERVVAAAIASRPDWASKTAREQAERIMDGGKAEVYDVAARWLSYARDAYRAAGHEAKWQAYYQSLLTTHHRKYKLIPLLKKLA